MPTRRVDRSDLGLANDRFSLRENRSNRWRSGVDGFRARAAGKSSLPIDGAFMLIAIPIVLLAVVITVLRVKHALKSDA